MFIDKGLQNIETRSPSSCTNDSDESSDIEGTRKIKNYETNHLEANDSVTCITSTLDKEESFLTEPDETKNKNICDQNISSITTKALGLLKKGYTTADLANVPQGVLLQLIESGHLQVHTEEDGSGHHYVAIPLHPSTVHHLQLDTRIGNNKLVNSKECLKNKNV